MKSVLKPLAKSISIPLVLTATASVTDAATQKKIFGSSMTTLIISNEEIDDTMKMINSLEEFGSLIKGSNETTKIEAKELTSGFRGMLLGTLDGSLLRNLFTDKGIMRQVKVKLKLVRMFNAASSFI